MFIVIQQQCYFSLCDINKKKLKKKCCQASTLKKKLYYCHRCLGTALKSMACPLHVVSRWQLDVLFQSLLTGQIVTSQSRIQATSTVYRKCHHEFQVTFYLFIKLNFRHFYNSLSIYYIYSEYILYILYFIVNTLVASSANIGKRLTIELSRQAASCHIIIYSIFVYVRNQINQNNACLQQQISTCHLPTQYTEFYKHPVYHILIFVLAAANLYIYKWFDLQCPDYISYTKNIGIFIVNK